MTSQITVTIITVCYNSEKTIENTIKSVLSQSYEYVEYIIVDGGSTDRTLNIIDRYKDQIDYVVSEPDNGIYDAMNKGIVSSNGDIIGILNSDDIYSTCNEIQEVVKHFERNPNKDLLFGNLIFKNFKTDKIIRYYSSNNFKPYKLRFGWMPAHPTTFVRKNIYQTHGLYKTDYKISADYEKFVKWLLVENLEYTYLDRTIVHMSLGGISTSGISSMYTLNKEIVKACRSNGIYTNMFFLVFKLPFKLLELIKNK